MQNNSPFDWKAWKRAHRLTGALAVGVFGLVLVFSTLSTGGIDYQQHPVAVVVGSVLPTLLVAVGVYWWWGQGAKPPK